MIHGGGGAKCVERGKQKLNKCLFVSVCDSMVRACGFMCKYHTLDHVA